MPYAYDRDNIFSATWLQRIYPTTAVLDMKVHKDCALNFNLMRLSAPILRKLLDSCLGYFVIKEILLV